MKNVAETLRAASHQLGGDEAQREAELLLCHVLGVSDAWLIAHADDFVTGAQVTQFLALVERRAEGEPVAYLTGRRGFYTLELAVTADVLIPRPETELLVELALRYLPENAPCALADLGTGSGAIALAIAAARPHARVTATDASVAALEVARGNALRLGLDKVEFAQGDWCAALGDRRFDVVVANPPYIAGADSHLQQGDLRFEPRAALASGADGLDAIRTLVREVPRHLHAGGWLLFEHGFDQGAAARGLLTRAGYRDVFTTRDLEGRERVSGGQWQ